MMQRWNKCCPVIIKSSHSRFIQSVGDNLYATRKIIPLPLQESCEKTCRCHGGVTQDDCQHGILYQHMCLCHQSSMRLSQPDQALPQPHRRSGGVSEWMTSLSGKVCLNQVACL